MNTLAQMPADRRIKQTNIIYAYTPIDHYFKENALRARAFTRTTDNINTQTPISDYLKKTRKAITRTQATHKHHMHISVEKPSSQKEML